MDVEDIRNELFRLKLTEIAEDFKNLTETKLIALLNLLPKLAGRYFELSDNIADISSCMPQKKNPDVLEVGRARIKMKLISGGDVSQELQMIASALETAELDGNIWGEDLSRETITDLYNQYKRTTTIYRDFSPEKVGLETKSEE